MPSTPMLRLSAGMRQGLLFVATAGAGWLLDTTVFMLLSGPGGWHVVAANMVSGSCGALFVFAVSARGIFERNRGSMAQKVGALLLFNAAVILASSLVLGAIAALLASSAVRLGWNVPLHGLHLAAKVLVTPVTLALNFVVVRYLLERFIGLRASPAPALRQGAR